MYILWLVIFSRLTILDYAYDISQELFTCTSRIYNNDPITQLNKATVLKQITWQSAQPISFHFILKDSSNCGIISAIYSSKCSTFNIIQQIQSGLTSYFTANHNIYSPAAVLLGGNSAVECLTPLR